MARNIEIKARIDSVDELMARVEAISNGPAVEIQQDDTFFKCERGRMKLRDFGDGTGVLIFYKRPDAQGPKECFYEVSETNQPDSLRDVLSHAYAQCGRVQKRRLLFLAGRTRVQLDEVVGLGAFLELEVVLQDGDSTESGVREANSIMTQLGIHASQLVEGAYLDLLESRR